MTKKKNDEELNEWELRKIFERLIDKWLDKVVKKKRDEQKEKE